MKNMIDLEDAAMRLRGIEHILLHISASEYLRAPGDAEMMQVLAGEVGGVRELLEGVLKKNY